MIEIGRELGLSDENWPRGSQVGRRFPVAELAGLTRLGSNGGQDTNTTVRLN